MFSGTYETDLHNPDFVKFAESFGAVGMRATSPVDIATLLPASLEQQRPALIDVPFADMPVPVAPQVGPVYSMPWTQPLLGLIAT